MYVCLFSDGVKAFVPELCYCEARCDLYLEKMLQINVTYFYYIFLWQLYNMKTPICIKKKTKKHYYYYCNKFTSEKKKRNILSLLFNWLNGFMMTKRALAVNQHCKVQTLLLWYTVSHLHRSLPPTWHHVKSAYYSCIISWHGTLVTYFSMSHNHGTILEQKVNGSHAPWSGLFKHR